MPKPIRNKLVPARLVMADELQEAGDFTWLCSSADANWPDAILFLCPCGCGKQSQVPLNVLANADIEGAKWTWDRNPETPSMKEQIVKEDGCYSAINLVQGQFVVR